MVFHLFLNVFILFYLYEYFVCMYVSAHMCTWLRRLSNLVELNYKWL